ncbi:conjugal transfer protein TraF [Enterovibrio norvegicus]|uniref:conjugal transfer protein TraF n=1 Tax=Enterovibrio norvegicus TaxID=188144 RepID=UPI00352D2C19
MRNQCIQILSGFAFLLAVSSLSNAQDYLQDDAPPPGGWHFYKDPPKEPEKKEIKPTPPPSKQQVKSQDKPLSAKWVKEMLPEFLMSAIDEPTPENVKRYRYVQRLAMDMSSEFSKAYTKESLDDPFTSEKLARPTAQFAITEKAKLVNNAYSDQVSLLAKKFRIMFFYRSDCPFCKRQTPILERLDSNGFEVLAISLDGKPLPGLPFDGEFVIDYDLKASKRFQVLNVPAMFLISKDKQHILPMAQQLTSENKLMDIALFQAREIGYVGAADVNKFKNVSEIPSFSNGISDIDPERAENDPDYLIEILKNQFLSDPDNLELLGEFQ